MSSAFDKIMLLPIMAKFIVPYILPYLIDQEESESLYGYVSMFLQFLMIIVANLTRRFSNCDNISFNSFGKATVDAFNENAFASLVPFLMGFVPFLGVFLSLFETFVGDHANNILWSIGFIIVYAITNKINESDMKEYCDAPFFGFTSDKIALFLSVVIIVVTNIY